MTTCDELSLEATSPLLTLAPGGQELTLAAAGPSLILAADGCELQLTVDARVSFDVEATELTLRTDPIQLCISTPIPMACGRTADGLTLKDPARVAADTNIATLSGLPPTIDGVAADIGDRILLTAQTNTADNGVWVVAAGAWSRPADFLPGSFAAANFLFVEQGNVYQDTGWLCINDSGTDIVGTHGLTWVRFTATGSAGAAGGDLDGTYPNPQVVAVTDSTNQRLPIDELQDGEFILRLGNQLRSAAAGAWYEDVFTATPGQTIFTLTETPVDAESFQLTINGVKYENDQYTLVGNVVTWLNIAFFMDGGETVLCKYINAFTIGAGTTQLGVPSDGTYDDGLLPLTPNTTVADAIDALNEAMAAIAPTPAGQLTGTILQPSVSLYSAKLPSGLPVAWEPYVPGDTVTGLILSSTPSLATADPATRFAAGLWSESPGGDRVYHVLDGSDADSRLVADGVGVTGTVEILTLVAYNGIWRKVTARVNLVLTEGQSRHRIRSDSAAQTDELRLHYDDQDDAPSFAVAPSVGVTTELLRYLSGIAYYREGTQFGVSFTAAVGIFRKHYHPTAVATITIPGASSVTKNPSSVPTVGSSFGVTSEPVTLPSSGVAALSPQCQVTLRKVVKTLTQGVALARGINTYATGASTGTVEQFVDELRRLVLGTGTPWTSSTPLATGNGQARNGSLVHGNDGDYPGHGAGTTAVYERRFSPGVQSGGTVRFTGVTASQVAQYGTGTLNVLLQLEGDGLWFDLGLDAPFVNGSGDGSTPANSIGARFGVSGGDLIFTLSAPASGGPYSTGGVNGGQYRLQVSLRGANGLGIASMEAL